MIAVAKLPASRSTPRCRKLPVTARQQERFLELAPAIRRHASVSFRGIQSEQRQELIQEVLARAWQAYVRLVEQGKEDLAYATPLAQYAVSQARAGRRLGSRLNVRDITSVHCQRAKGVYVEHLVRYMPEEEAWEEILVEDRRATPAEVAITRIDFAAWLRKLPKRNRRIALALAEGSTTKEVSRRFQLAPGRISQLRREFLDSWRGFQGELA